MFMISSFICTMRLMQSIRIALTSTCKGHDSSAPRVLLNIPYVRSTRTSMAIDGRRSVAKHTSLKSVRVNLVTSP